MLAHIQANQLVFAAQIELVMRKDRAGPAGIMQLWDLPGAEFLRRSRVWRKQSQFSSFAQNPKPPVCQNCCAPAVNGRLTIAMWTPPFRTAPHQLARGKLDASKQSIRFVAPTE